MAPAWADLSGAHCANRRLLTHRPRALLPPAAAPRAALLFSRRRHAPAPAVFGASFWAHPIWLSQPAIAAAQRGILAGGIRDQCEVVHPR